MAKCVTFQLHMFMVKILCLGIIMIYKVFCFQGAEHCPLKLAELVDKYFLPHSKGGITLDMIDDAFPVKHPLFKMEHVALVQVLDNQVYIDDRFMKHRPPSTRRRFSVILLHLREFLERREKDCQKGLNSCNKDFEFVIDFKCCQPGWRRLYYDTTEVIYNGQSEEESIKRYSRLPVFTITKCEGRDNIPIPQWTYDRDGRFNNWDMKMKKLGEAISKYPHRNRKNEVIFKGILASFSSFNPEGRAKPTHIDDDNWHLMSRCKLQLYSLSFPDRFKINIMDPKLFSNTTMQSFKKAIERNNPKYTTMKDQLKDHRHVIYAEGWCGYADRLKHLLFYNSTILFQETPCKEYYAHLLIPGEHYVPVDGNYENLLEQSVWLTNNPEESERIADNAHKFAKEYMSNNGILCYTNMVFEKFSTLMAYKPVKRDDTKLFDLKMIPMEWPEDSKYQPFKTVKRSKRT